MAPHHIDSDHRVTAALTKGGTNPTDLLGRMYQQMLSEIKSKQESQQEDNAGTQQGPDAAPKPEAPQSDSSDSSTGSSSSDAKADDMDVETGAGTGPATGREQQAGWDEAPAAEAQHRHKEASQRQQGGHPTAASSGAPEVS